MHFAFAMQANRKQKANQVNGCDIYLNRRVLNVPEG